MNPSTGEVLALANWPRVDANQPWTPPPTPLRTARSARRTSPARRSSRSPSPAPCRTGPCSRRPPFDCRPQIQVADRTIGEAQPRGYVTLTTAQILAQSSKVARSRSAWRWAAALRLLGAALRLRQADRRRPARRGARDRAPVSSYSGSSMGNLPIGQGIAVTPMQMAQGLRRDRQRRDPALAARRAPSRRQARPEPEGHARDLREAPPTSCARCSRRLFAPAGTASEVSAPRLQARRQDRHREQDRPLTAPSTRRPLRRVVPSASRPRCTPSADRRDGRRAAGAIYSGVGPAAPAFRKIASFALPVHAHPALK
jgi:hypothetical protein